MKKNENLFSIGEVAKYQNISKQTLIFYDKVGLFRPAWVDPENGYRYYSASQLDYLDTILIMKQIGFSLQEIKDHMQHYDLDSSLAMLHRQLDVIDQKVAGLRMIRSRVQNRCDQMEAARAHCAPGRPGIELEDAPEQELFCLPVAAPYTMREILVPVFRNGECVYQSPSVKEIAQYCRQEKDTLWDETKRLFYPHEVHVDLSQSLYDVKKALLDEMTDSE